KGASRRTQRAHATLAASAFVVIGSNITPELAAEHGLSHQEFDRAVAILGRTPNLTELGIFAAMWSEHCSYKSSKVWLKTLPTTGPRVICGPGENAGVVDIGDGEAVVFKIESHNHPSFIEPYQGAATGGGGILRDVFTMGARPIALLTSLRFGSPDHPKTRHLLSGVVAAIVAIQDMGAAGLTSSSVEMAGKGGLGIELDLDHVPVREAGMTPYEIMLSESQERMLMILAPGSEAEARRVFDKWELDFAVIGRVTDTGRLVLRMHGETAAEIPVGPLVTEAPLYQRPWTRRTPLPDIDPAALPARDPLACLKRLLACPDLASKRWIWEQYDYLVRGNTVKRPGGDAAVVRISEAGKALA